MSSFLEYDISSNDVPTKIYRSSQKQVSLRHPIRNTGNTNQSTRSVLKSTKKNDITIALVGEIGGGRTSFMSLLVNLLLGVQSLELIDRYDPSNEFKVTIHEVTTLDDTVIQILDTPNLSTKDDNTSITKIGSAMRENVQYIDAIIIVADGHTPHLTAATLSAITVIFPRTIVDNIGFVFANSGWVDWKFQMNSLPSELQNAKHWLFHNPHAALEDYQKTKKESHNEENKIKEALDQVLDHYKLAVDTLDEWIEWVDSRNHQRTKDIPRGFDLAEKVQEKIKVIESNSADLRKVEGLIKERESKIIITKAEAERIRGELENTPDMPIPQRQYLKKRLGEVEDFIRHYEDVRTRLQQALIKHEEHIETAQADIRHFVDDFHRISYSQNFKSGITATIKMLEGSKTDTEDERKFINEIIEMLKDKLSNASE